MSMMITLIICEMLRNFSNLHFFGELFGFEWEVIEVIEWVP